MTSSYRIEQAMSAAMQIRAMLGDTEDEKLLADTIDGETDVLEILDRLVEQALADEALVEGARERIKRLEARPETTLCIRCKEDQERQEKDFA